MKEGCLFVLFVLMRSTAPGCFRSLVLGVFGKVWTRRRSAWDWFHDVWTCGTKVLEY